MKKEIITTTLVLVSIFTYSQVEDTMRVQLSQLNKPKRITHKYVNFDVFKIKIGQGFATKDIRYRTSLSIEFQVLHPVALLKDHWPIAWGISFGAVKFSMPNTQLIAGNNELIEIKDNDHIRATTQRTGYIGFIVFPIVKQFKSAGITFLGGISSNLNMVSRLRLHTKEENVRFLSGRYTNRFSLPVHIQISYSKRQFVSFGIYASYDTRPRFKGEKFTNMKQMVMGGSIAFII